MAPRDEFAVDSPPPPPRPFFLSETLCARVAKLATLRGAVLGRQPGTEDGHGSPAFRDRINSFVEAGSGDFSHYIGEGTLDVTVTFDPMRAVPEPATAVLLGIGLAMLARRSEEGRR